MKLVYKRIGLMVKVDLSQKEKIVEKVLLTIQSIGAEVFIEPASCGALRCARFLPVFSAETDLDAMLVIGGDGTILRAVRTLPSLSIPILSINRGVVGFLAELSVDEVEAVLPSLLSGECQEEKRSLVKVAVQRDKVCVFESFALNEVAIAQGAMSRLIDLRTTIDNRALADFHADGLIIATPTGSTAYSLAAGGPIVHPHLHALVLTPINPHSLTQKPVVILGESIVQVQILDASMQHNVNVSMTVDGQLYTTLQANDTVTAHMHTQSITFIRKKDDTFYRTLRTKLRWGERV